MSVAFVLFVVEVDSCCSTFCQGAEETIREIKDEWREWRKGRVFVLDTACGCGSILLFIVDTIVELSIELFTYWVQC
ncbi:hypothetical protein F5H01DRAFT_332607 [Linnemannia elongata]|nr:hypothetical protein F5H01DRAFT_332607 [Linnemannia elongata]